jgi:hypothetical protein
VNGNEGQPSMFLGHPIPTDVDKLRQENSALRCRIREYEERIRHLERWFKEVALALPGHRLPPPPLKLGTFEAPIPEASIPPDCRPIDHGRICPVCSGDGGATGHCRKCGGTGWFKD